MVWLRKEKRKLKKGGKEHNTPTKRVELSVKDKPMFLSWRLLLSREQGSSSKVKITSGVS
jgi:hypothetical protein